MDRFLKRSLISLTRKDSKTTEPLISITYPRSPLASPKQPTRVQQSAPGRPQASHPPPQPCLGVGSPAGQEGNNVDMARGQQREKRQQDGLEDGSMGSPYGTRNVTQRTAAGSTKNGVRGLREGNMFHPEAECFRRQITGSKVLGQTIFARRILDNAWLVCLFGGSLRRCGRLFSFPRLLVALRASRFATARPPTTLKVCLS